MAIEVQSKAFTAATVGAYSVNTSAVSDVLGASTNSLASNSITVTDGLAGKKVVVEINIHTAFDNVAANLLIEGSLSAPGVTLSWATLDTLSSDVTPDVLGAKVFVADLTDYVNIPYIRFHFNANAAAVNTAGKCQFKYAVLA